MKGTTKALLYSMPLTVGVMECPIVRQFAKEVADNMIKSNPEHEGLTLQEIQDGYTIDPVLGRINVAKAMQERSDAIRREYEAFDTMHLNDGSFTSKRFSCL